MCDVLVAAPEISRQHAAIVHSSSATFVFDLKSIKGTFVDGIRVDPAVPVRCRDGAVLQLGTDSDGFCIRWVILGVDPTDAKDSDSASRRDSASGREHTVAQPNLQTASDHAAPPQCKRSRWSDDVSILPSGDAEAAHVPAGAVAQFGSLVETRLVPSSQPARGERLATRHKASAPLPSRARVLANAALQLQMDKRSSVEVPTETPATVIQSMPVNSARLPSRKSPSHSPQLSDDVDDPEVLILRKS